MWKTQQKEPLDTCEDLQASPGSEDAAKTRFGTCGIKGRNWLAATTCWSSFHHDGTLSHLVPNVIGHGVGK